MWAFVSTLFFLWCVWRVWVWIFPGKAAREQKRAAKAARAEQDRVDKMMAEYNAKRQRELSALGLEAWRPGVRRQCLPFDKVLKWEGGEVLRLVYSPALESLEIKAEFSRDSKNGAHVCAGARVEVWVSHRDYGHAVVVAPAEGVWCPVISDGSLLSPGDVILELDTTPGALLLREELQEKERAERVRLRTEKEKAEIAENLKERQRRRELEKQVRLELIDSGELFGDEPKRPPIPREVVDAVYRRDGARCVYCGSTENLQLDHIIPFSKGGATSLENLQLLCQKCNLEKSNKIG